MVVGVDGRSLIGAHPRGVAAYLRGLLAALAAARPSDELRVSLPAGPLLPGALPETGNVLAVRHHRGSRRLHGAAALAGRPRLDRLLGRPDVLWLPAPAPVAVDPGTPYVLSVHDLAWEERPRDFTPYERAWHAAARPRRLANRAARLAAVSHATAEAIRSRWGLEAAVVPAGPGEPGPLDAAPERFGAPHVLFVGALEPRKAPEILAGAHARARAQGLRAPLVLAGAGRLGNRLKGDGVHLLGHVAPPRKAALYRGALAVALPSWLEGYGYPPLEGFAHGIPSVAADVPALRETAGPGALLVPPGDPAALAEALLILENHEEQRTALAAAGARTLPDRAWDRCAAALWPVLEEAAR